MTVNRSNEVVDSSTTRFVSVFDFLSFAARVSTGSKIRQYKKEKYHNRWLEVYQDYHLTPKFHVHLSKDANKREQFVVDLPHQMRFAPLFDIV